MTSLNSMIIYYARLFRVAKRSYTCFEMLHIDHCIIDNVDCLIICWAGKWDPQKYPIWDLMRTEILTMEALTEVSPKVQAILCTCTTYMY